MQTLSVNKRCFNEANILSFIDFLTTENWVDVFSQVYLHRSSFQ